jgi:hypothetical protein
MNGRTGTWIEDEDIKLKDAVQKANIGDKEFLLWFQVEREHSFHPRHPRTRALAPPPLRPSAFANPKTKRSKRPPRMPTENHLKIRAVIENGEKWELNVAEVNGRIDE